jgi:hypothetical protein
MSVINYNNATNNAANERISDMKIMDKSRSKLPLGLNAGVGPNDLENSETLTKLKVEEAKTIAEPANINDYEAQIKIMETVVISMSEITKNMQNLALTDPDKILNQSDLETLNVEFEKILSKKLIPSSAFELGNVANKGS